MHNIQLHPHEHHTHGDFFTLSSFPMTETAHYQSPLGLITLAVSEEHLIGLWFNDQQHFGSTLPTPIQEQRENPNNPIIKQTRTWLDAYFAGKDPSAIPPLFFVGSSFRCQVWKELLTIPYGETRTYKQIALALQRKSPNKYISPRAVGGAVAHNPISIIVPCHRVIGTNGTLTGYAGGIERKAFLLACEQQTLVP